MSGETPGQTIGPFFAIMQPLGAATLVASGRADCIALHGTLFDGAGAPVSDGLIEIWQANASGRYDHPADERELLLDPEFTGFGRCATGPDGAFSFTTLKPGIVPAAEGDSRLPPSAR